MLTTWINVKELVRLGLDENKSLGIMRLDYCSSRPNEVCNQWFPSPKMNQVLMEHPISIQQLQQELNELIFNQLDVFDKVTEKCGGEGYKREETFKVESESFKFFIRLKPVQDDYSHLFVYAK
ncbi:hypothetical protein [Turicibacter sanguinis]|uniref:hypothetical protein n=1 Tax=Turicibacter sanguinis TaxID=154288 RepID=UPI0011C7BAC8|nr:hypothetical protein [Turicibacter sanguinis]MBP3907588.1 hypothetical protein [Turicibacter sp.]